MPSGNVHRTPARTTTSFAAAPVSAAAPSSMVAIRAYRRRASVGGLRVAGTVWSAMIFGGLLLVTLATLAAGQAGPPQTCPPVGDINPCQCQVKKNGLDILCEATDVQHITRAMSALKGKNPIIFYLKLRHNNLPKLQGFVFLSLDIRHLTIHNSSLAAIEETSLSSLGRGLTQLDVSQNQLMTVPSAALKNLHHLLILNLNHNRISAIHNRAFEGLDTLEILTIYENKLSSIEPDAFRGLDKKLKRLNLGGNELTAVPQKALAILDMLRKLELQENRLKTIKEGDFEGLQNLDSLILAHNQLTEVPARVFSHLILLNSLELEGNSISYIDKDAFEGLEENLQYLRLGDNNLHRIPSEALRPLHRLRHLDLRSNNISSINEDAFVGFGDSITFLNLQKNDIKVLPALVFENLNSLETLSIQNNKLTRIPEEVMEPIMDSLRVVDIMDNPLICSCELVWFPNLLRDLKNRDDEMTQKKRPMCTMANEHREYYVQTMPLERMNCVGKKYQTSSLSGNGAQSGRIHGGPGALTVAGMAVATAGVVGRQLWMAGAGVCQYYYY